MKRGVVCVYFGDINDACDYFVSHDNSLYYDKELDNPADFVIEVVGGNQSNKLSDSSSNNNKVFENTNINWTAVWNNSAQRRQVLAQQDELEREAVASGIDFTTSAWSVPSYMTQLITIIKRQYVIVISRAFLPILLIRFLSLII